MKLLDDFGVKTTMNEVEYVIADDGSDLSWQIRELVAAVNLLKDRVRELESDVEWVYDKVCHEIL